jgi:hypothetical protein
MEGCAENQPILAIPVHAEPRQEHLLPNAHGFIDAEYIAHYRTAHEEFIRTLFAPCAERLLEVSVTDADCAQRIREFTGYPIGEMPHANKTQVPVAS